MLLDGGLSNTGREVGQRPVLQIRRDDPKEVRVGLEVGSVDVRCESFALEDGRHLAIDQQHTTRPIRIIAQERAAACDGIAHAHHEEALPGRRPCSATG